MIIDAKIKKGHIYRICNEATGGIHYLYSPKPNNTSVIDLTAWITEIGKRPPSCHSVNSIHELNLWFLFVSQIRIHFTVTLHSSSISSVHITVDFTHLNILQSNKILCQKAFKWTIDLVRNLLLYLHFVKRLTLVHVNCFHAQYIIFMEYFIFCFSTEEINIYSNFKQLPHFTTCWKAIIAKPNIKLTGHNTS